MATNPDNKNFLSPIGFQFAIQRLPNVNYFCTSASIPEISMGETETPNPFIRLPNPGEKLAFGQLQLQFRVDEDLKNFQEIYNWLIGLGYPDEFSNNEELLFNDFWQNVNPFLSFLDWSTSFVEKHFIRIKKTLIVFTKTSLIQWKRNRH